MATTFLRKIILEELKKVLKEDWFTDNVADDTGTATYTPYQKETPEEVDLGTTTFNVKRSKPVNPNTVAIIKIQKSLIKIMGPEYKTSWPKVSGVLDKHTKKLIKILYPRLNLDKITNFSALSAVFEQRVQRGGLSIDGETFDQQLDKAVAAAAAAEQRRASASAGVGKDTEIPADSPMSTDDLGLPKPSDDVKVPFTDKATMDKAIGPRTMFKHDPEAVTDTGPKKGMRDEEEDVKVKLGEPDLEQEALVRAISKLLKTL